MDEARTKSEKKERGVIGPLSWWLPVNHDLYRNACNFLEHRLNTVADLVSEYMG